MARHRLVQFFVLACQDKLSYRESDCPRYSIASRRELEILAEAGSVQIYAHATLQTTNTYGAGFIEAGAVLHVLVAPDSSTKLFPMLHGTISSGYVLVNQSRIPTAVGC